MVLKQKVQIILIIQHYYAKPKKVLRYYKINVGCVLEKMWEVDKVSSQFSIWIPQGITLNDALYETWLQGFINVRIGPLKP